MIIQHLPVAVALLAVALCAGCGRGGEKTDSAPASKPSILLVTLDTTRADAIGPEAAGVETPAFNARRRARAPVPPGLRDGAGDAAVAQLDDDRPLSGRPRRARERAARSRPAHPLVAERLQQAGLSHRARSSRRSCWRGGSASRAASTSTTTSCRRARASAPPRETTDAGARRISTGAVDAAAASLGPLLRSARAVRAAGAVSQPIRGEAVPRRGRGDGRAARPARAGVRAARAPGAAPRSSSPATTAKGSAITASRSTATCSISRRCTCRWCWRARASRRASATRRSARAAIFHTVARLGRARTRPTACAATAAAEVVLGEAMKPFLEYGWQPQIMAVDGPSEGDPRREDSRSTTSRPIRRRRSDLGPGADLPRRAAQGAGRLSGAVAGGRARAGQRSTDEARRKLASLGYVSAGARAGRPEGRAAAGRHDAAASTSRAGVGRCSSQEQYARGDPAARADPGRGSVQPRRDAAAGDRALVARARRAGAGGVQAGRGDRAALAGRAALPRAALRARPGVGARGAAARAGRRRDARAAAGARGAGRRSASKQGRPREAIALRQQIYALRTPTAAELVAARPAGDGRAADSRWRSSRSRRRARRQGSAFTHDLELGVLYLAARRFDDARARSTASRRHIPSTRWRSSSARRSACC